MDLNQILLVLHFVGLGLGMSATFANPTIGKLIAEAAPAEKAVLARFPPRQSHISGIGLVLLWVTGLGLVYSKYGGFGNLPWQFHAKLTGVVLLTLVVGLIHALMAKARRGDAAAAARIPVVGSVAGAISLLIVLFAVLAFD